MGCSFAGGVFIFAWLTGYWAAILILYLALYIVRQVWSLYQFEAWLHGDSDAVAPSSGFWQVLCFLFPPATNVGKTCRVTK